jgi:uncharacterized protein (UPF0548 family)
MFFMRRPSVQAIERFIAGSQELPLSYREIGIARNGAPAYDLDEAAVTIGRGRSDYERARASLAGWKHFDIGWVELFPVTASVEAGTVVVVLARHFGFWSLNGCRIVYGIGQSDPDRFGFAYGTLTNHGEEGEELFEVFRDRHTDDVIYRLRAVSRPGAPLTRLGYPLVRRLQARFRRDSVEAMKRATSGEGVRR